MPMFPGAHTRRVNAAGTLYLYTYTLLIWKDFSACWSIFFFSMLLAAISACVCMCTNGDTKLAR
jgi:hypothetical protein